MGLRELATRTSGFGEAFESLVVSDCFGFGVIKMWGRPTITMSVITLPVSRISASSMNQSLAMMHRTSAPALWDYFEWFASQLCPGSYLRRGGLDGHKRPCLRPCKGLCHVWSELPKFPNLAVVWTLWFCTICMESPPTLGGVLDGCRTRGGWGGGGGG